MTQIHDVLPLKSMVADFIDGLRTMEREPVTTPRVAELVAQMRPSAESLAPYLLWNRERYARNLIYRDNFFEVIALCWLPGQRTPIHSHNGQLGWVTMVQGELVCRNYRFTRSLLPKQMPLASRYQACAGRRVEVDLLNSATCQADGSVVVVDRRQTTHQLENFETSRYGSVSLHVYSKPIDSCVLFDETSRCCERRQLEYHSANGVILKKAQRYEQLTEAVA